jgi:hypothetical protein
VRFHVAANLTRLVDLRTVDSAAADALIRLCHDDDADTRYYALYAATREIAGMNLEQVITLTAELMNDPDHQISTMATKHHQAIGAVRRFLTEEDPGRVFVPETPTGAYDYMIGPILVGLACESGVSEIRDVLNEEIRRGFGTYSPHVDITNMTQRLVTWWRIESAAA